MHKQNATGDIFFSKKENRYHGISRNEMLIQALALNDYFTKLNIKSQDNIAIISENRIEWVVTDFACMFSGAVNVPLYTSLSPESIKYILKDSKAIACFVSNLMQYEKVLKIKNELPDLKHIISFNYIENKYSDRSVINFSDIIKKKSKLDNKKLIEKIEEVYKKIYEDNLLTIIYTSGTTGTPKGVMLTQKNLYSNVLSCMNTLPITEKDVFLSYLPYSHIFERTAGYYLAFFSGSIIYYAQSIDTIGVQMPEVKPTIVMTVPRLLDKMYNKLIKSAEEMPDGYKKNLFVNALHYAKTRGKNENSLKWKFYNRVVYKKIREKTGGKLRFFVSGGGALNKTIGHFFDAIGILALEGYGMTESSPAISFNLPHTNVFGTVGFPLCGVLVKLAEDGEILVKGDLIMKGYYNNQDETNNTIIDGWLHTGDLGAWHPRGNLMITDRKKSLFKSSGGKYIAPQHIEELILQIPYVDQVLAIGNEKMYVTALMVHFVYEAFVFFFDEFSFDF